MSCSQCLEPYDAEQRRPKSLPCGHSVCLGCLRGLNKVECPVDSKVFITTADTLPDNHAVLEMAKGDQKPVVWTRRFWCNDCGKVASEECLDEHAVSSLKKARTQRAQAPLAALKAGEVAVSGLRAELDGAARGLEAEVALCRGILDDGLRGLGIMRRCLEAAIEADEAVFVEACKPLGLDGLAREASLLLPALGDAASTLSLSLRGPGAACTASLRPREQPAARLLLCQLLCAGELTRTATASTEQGGHDGQDEDGQDGRQDGERRAVEEATAKGAERLASPPRTESTQRALPEALPEGLPGPPPRPPLSWTEKSNGGVELDNEAMASRMAVRSRVVRGADWPTGSTADGVPPAPGTVVAEEADNRLTVQWDRGGRGAYTMGVVEKDMSRCRYELALLPSGPHYKAVCGVPSYTSMYLSVLTTCLDDQKRVELLRSDRLNKVRVLMDLRCDAAPDWSLQVLRRVAPRLEALRLEAPDADHLRVVRDMPALQELFLSPVDTETLQLALDMPDLVGLEAHCAFEAPLGEVSAPPAACLTWLCLGVYPLSAALAVVRAHAATLETLELVAASVEPYGCPDLAAELRRCGLRSLKTLELRRESSVHFCRHDEASCKSQVQQLADMFRGSGLTVLVQCFLCGY